ncbi:peptidylprolyl isomerase [Microcystis aeruginosa]|uniref:Uncharacterized protein n=1 Tax=Microcystis aeruginosa NIES-2521 TaxID=2303983 RepID=A0A5A5RQX3_MICAE|nr:peptidylprolyl isomerase [Microcystis aeruginosa]GCA78963.1 hypothetical protein MiTs_00950 [Microcystis aeruginosa NIES-2521]
MVDYHRMIARVILIDRRVELPKVNILEMSPEFPLHRGSGKGLSNFICQRFEGKAQIREAV